MTIKIKAVVNNNDGFEISNARPTFYFGSPLSVICK